MCRAKVSGALLGIELIMYFFLNPLIEGAQTSKSFSRSVCACLRCMKLLAGDEQDVRSFTTS